MLALLFQGRDQLQSSKIPHHQRPGCMKRGLFPPAVRLTLPLLRSDVPVVVVKNINSPQSKRLLKSSHHREPHDDEGKILELCISDRHCAANTLLSHRSFAMRLACINVNPASMSSVMTCNLPPKLRVFVRPNSHETATSAAFKPIPFPRAFVSSPQLKLRSRSKT